MSTRGKLLLRHGIRVVPVVLFTELIVEKELVLHDDEAHGDDGYGLGAYCGRIGSLDFCALALVGLPQGWRPFQSKDPFHFYFWEKKSLPPVLFLKIRVKEDRFM